jgi:putative acetyltransferase
MLTNSIEIQDYIPSDEGQVLEVVACVLSEHGFEYDPKVDSDLKDISREYIRFLVVKDQCRVVGCAGIKRVSGDVAEFKRLYLLSEYRGRGLGGNLLESCVKYCFANQFKTIILDTTLRNNRAMVLFEKHGFRETWRNGEEVFLKNI